MLDFKQTTLFSNFKEKKVIRMWTLVSKVDCLVGLLRITKKGDLKNSLVYHESCVTFTQFSRGDVSSIYVWFSLIAVTDELLFR